MVRSVGDELATKKQHLRVCLFIFEKRFFWYTIFENSFIKSVSDGKLIVNALTKRYY